jgi:hypothetical protein
LNRFSARSPPSLGGKQPQEICIVKDCSYYAVVQVPPDGVYP